MAEIAALVALALNDKGIPHEIASLVALARNDKVARHCEGTQCPRQSPALESKGIPAFGGAPKAGQKGGGDTFGCVPCTPATIRALPLTHTLSRRGFISGNRNCYPSLRASHASAAISYIERIKLLFFSHGWDCFGISCLAMTGRVRMSLRANAVSAAISYMRN